MEQLTFNLNPVALAEKLNAGQAFDVEKVCGKYNSRVPEGFKLTVASCRLELTADEKYIIRCWTITGASLRTSPVRTWREKKNGLCITTANSTYELTYS